MVENPLIVLVDDETDLAEALAEYLRHRGYRTRVASSGEALFAMLPRITPDLVILDLAMPGEDGRTVLRTLRAERDVPVMVLTSTDDAADRIVLIESGADDYVVKPVEPRELAARAGRLLGRNGARAAATFRFEAVTADLAGGQLLFDDGREEKLTLQETALLRALTGAAGRVLSRDDILAGLPEEQGDVFDRSVDHRIARLRKKLGTGMIVTVRGAGYRIALPD